MLTVRVYSKGVHIGDADLQATDASMGCAGGPFRPLPAYAAVRSEVRAFGEAIARNRRESYPAARARFDALELALVADDGAVLEGSGGLDIYDLEGLDEDSIELHVFGVCQPDGAYQRYFSGDPAYRD